MNPAQHYSVLDHLKDGTEVIFRAVRPEDKEKITMVKSPRTQISLRHI